MLIDDITAVLIDDITAALINDIKAVHINDIKPVLTQYLSILLEVLDELGPCDLLGDNVGDI